MDELTLVDLCDAADVSPRTIRYYITRGLLPPASSHGPQATYTQEHLHRLKLVKALQRQHLPLAEIRKRMATLADGEAEQLLVGAEPQPAEAHTPSSAQDYITGVLSQSRSPGSRSPLAQTSLPIPSHAHQPGAPAQPSLFQGTVQSTWERHHVHPDVENHVRRPLDYHTRRQLDRLFDFARQLFKENP